MWTKFGLKLRKISRCGRPGGGGGVVSDFGHPRTRGEGGQKRANFCGRPLWMTPKHLRFKKLDRYIYLSRHGSLPISVLKSVLSEKLLLLKSYHNMLNLITCNRFLVISKGKTADLAKTPEAAPNKKLSVFVICVFSVSFNL